MRIEQHDIALQTQYKSSESELTKSIDEWKTTLIQEIQSQQSVSSTVSVEEESESLEDVMEEMKCELINDLFKLFEAKDQSEGTSPAASQLIELTESSQKEFKRLGIPFTQFSYTEERDVSESISASVKGCVCTSDGREIPLDVNLNMSQSFHEKIEFSQSVFTDPLVVNFNGKLPELEEACFSFDIDCDGESDQISTLAKGNGFLALDKNSNGSIDDGSELFGTESGNGFADLSEYDKDGNDWIDEGDDIYDKLRVWSTDGENSQLVALGESGIGAIYLGSAATEFTYRNTTRESLGALRSTGIFLYENGKSGNISQVDFAKQGESANLSKALSTLDA